MSSKDVVIIGANRTFWDHLERLVRTLRGPGEHRGMIVVVENSSWNNGKYREGLEFEDWQRKILTEYQVVVLNYQILLDINKVEPKMYQGVKSKHYSAYPAKVVILALVTKAKQLKQYDRVMMLDADILCQGSILPIFNSITPGTIGMVAEKKSIGDNENLAEWMAVTQYDDLTGNYTTAINSCPNYNSGMIVGDIRTVNAYATLAWTMAKSSLVDFRSDQPLANVIINYFRFPFTPLGYNLCYNWTDHLDPEIEDGVIHVRHFTPPLVHFNGKTLKPKTRKELGI